MSQESKIDFFWTKDKIKYLLSLVLQLECKYEYEEVNWESIKESTYCVHISKIVKKITSLQM